MIARLAWFAPLLAGAALAAPETVPNLPEATGDPLPALRACQPAGAELARSPRAHPYLFFTAAERGALRARLVAEPFRSLGREVLARADADIGKPLPPPGRAFDGIPRFLPDGDFNPEWLRHNYDDFYHQAYVLRDVIPTLGFAYQLTGEAGGGGARPVPLRPGNRQGRRGPERFPAAHGWRMAAAPPADRAPAARRPRGGALGLRGLVPAGGPECHSHRAAGHRRPGRLSENREGADALSAGGALTTSTQPTAPSSSVTGNFSNPAIAAGNTIWFSSSVQVNGYDNAPGVQLYFTASTITFKPSASAATVTIAVPAAEIIFTPYSTTAVSTTFNAGTNTWVTMVPEGFSGNIFLTGVAYQVSGAGGNGGHDFTGSMGSRGDIDPPDTLIHP